MVDVQERAVSALEQQLLILLEAGLQIRCRVANVLLQLLGEAQVLVRYRLSVNLLGILKQGTEDGLLAFGLGGAEDR